MTATTGALYSHPLSRSRNLTTKLFSSWLRRIASSALPSLCFDLSWKFAIAMFVAFLATPAQVEKIKRGGEPYGYFNDLATTLDALFKTDGLFTMHAGDAWKFLNGMTTGP